MQSPETNNILRENHAEAEMTGTALRPSAVNRSNCARMHSHALFLGHPGNPCNPWLKMPQTDASSREATQAKTTYAPLSPSPLCTPNPTTSDPELLQSTRATRYDTFAAFHVATPGCPNTVEHLREAYAPE